MRVSRLKELAVSCAENFRSKISQTGDLDCAIKCELLGIVNEQPGVANMFDDVHIVPRRASAMYEFTGTCDGSTVTRSHTVAATHLRQRGLNVPLEFARIVHASHRRH